MITVAQERFEAMVDDALDKIPDQFATRMRNLAIMVHDYNEDNPQLLGLYVGVALPERTFDHTGYLPDAIFIYQGALQDWCDTEEQLAHEVEVTLFHELGHYFGLEEDQLHHLGWG